MAVFLTWLSRNLQLGFGGLCRKYTLAEYEERASEVLKREFGASGNLPARMVEVRILSSLLLLQHPRSPLQGMKSKFVECVLAICFINDCRHASPKNLTSTAMNYVTKN